MARSLLMRAAVAATSAAPLILMAAAQPTLASVSARPASVLRTPAVGTPQLAPTGTTEQVRHLVQCGKLMYAVGSFTAIRRHDITFKRHNIFSFQATAPFAITAWH